MAFLVAHLPLWLEEVQHGDPIAVRDRFECQFPGCSLRSGSAHHIRFRSQGGPDEPWNEIFGCNVHHLDGVHRGWIRVSGRAPDQLLFELGIRSDGTPVERFFNEERLFPGEGVTRGWPEERCGPRIVDHAERPEDRAALSVDGAALPVDRALFLLDRAPVFADSVKPDGPAPP